MPEDKLTTWYKKDGSEVKINDSDANVETAMSLGWDTKKPSNKAPKKASE